MAYSYDLIAIFSAEDQSLSFANEIKKSTAIGEDFSVFSGDFCYLECNEVRFYTVVWFGSFQLFRREKDTLSDFYSLRKNIYLFLANCAAEFDIAHFELETSEAMREYKITESEETKGKRMLDGLILKQEYFNEIKSGKEFFEPFARKNYFWLPLDD